MAARGGAGKWLVGGGLAVLLGTIVGWPFLDKFASCGWLDVSCALLRFGLYWLLVVLGLGMAVVGLFVLLKGEKGGAEALGYGVGFGREAVGYGRRGGRFVKGRVARKLR